MIFYRFPLHQKYIFVLHFNTLTQVMGQITFGGADDGCGLFESGLERLVLTGFDLDCDHFEYHRISSDE